MRKHDVSAHALTPGRIARFWLPLEATWLMMAAEGPFLAAVIARLTDPKENLAAFAVASALAWIVESPIIMMLSASNALVRDAVAYRKLRRFAFVLNASISAVMVVLITPPVFAFVARGVMGLTPDVAGLAGRSMIFLVLWPAAIGFRRFYQGILIRNGRPEAVTWGTVIRLATMAATGLVAALVFRLPGASVGAAALGAGVIAEGAASWVMARPTVQGLRGMSDEQCAFGRSLTTFFLARGRMPLESLAVLPVIVGLAFVFRTAGIAMQEVVIALVGDAGENRPILSRFSMRLGLASSAGLAVILYSPLAAVWYGTVSGLAPDLAAFALLPGGLLVLLPFLESILSYERGVLVKSNRTTPISVAVACQLAVTTAVFALMVLALRTAGAVAVGPALTAGYVAGVAVLLLTRRIS